jgi:periplasmic protein TonB
MSLDSETQPSSAQNLGLLQSCLVEGDPEQRRLERQVRRKALVTSVLLQASLLAAVILVPLFAKPALLVRPIVTPVPPYRQASEPPHQTPSSPSEYHHRVCTTCWDAKPPALNSSKPIPASEAPIITGEGIDRIPAAACPACITGGTGLPQPSLPTEPRPEKPPRIVTRLDPAMLIHRVEPTYPTLARQTRRAGRVEMRAIIATDGTIQSLHVVSGDPLFYQSAIEAVSQWRYRPTVLNGEPVEIDTFITVIYNIDAH